MIYISEKARIKLIFLMEKEGIPKNKSFVRLGIKDGGCSGVSYEISFDKEIKKDDELFQYKEIKILITKNNVPSLKDIKLEYSDGLNGKGFYFKNPNAKHTCGCGKSFSL